MNKYKKAQISGVKVLAMSIIALVLMIAIGITILSKLGDSTVTCNNELTTTSINEEAIDLEGIPSHINTTTSTLLMSTTQGFTLDLASIAIINATSGTIITAGNYTITAGGVLRNSTISPVKWNNVAINYTYTSTDNHAWNTTTQTCLNETGGDPITGGGSGYTSLAYGVTQLGSTGLLSWLPAIIALVIGLYFLASFMGNRKEY